jgi:o-succinylbenzoate synthase
MIHFDLSPRTFHFAKPAATSRGLLTERRVLLVGAHESGKPHVRGLGEAGPIPGLSRDDLPHWEQMAGDLVVALNRAEWPAIDVARPPLEGVSALLAPFEEMLGALPSLRFGIETALLELATGATGRLFPSAFAHGQAALPTHGLLWMDSIDGLRAQAAAKVRAGYHVLKLKVGALPLEEEVALLRELRAAQPRIALRLDANGAFTLAEAHTLLDRLAPLGIEFIEQPLPPGRAEDLARLVAASPIPIALDEELIALDEAQRANLLGRLAERTAHPPVAIVKPALLGGFAPADALADACDRLGIPWIANSLLEAAPGHSAICQWTAARLEQQPADQRRIHGLGSGALFADNLPSPIALVGAELHWRGRALHE